MLKVLIVSQGSLPVPAVQGGAVESIIDNLVASNEKHQKLTLVIASIFDKRNNGTKKECAEYFNVKNNALIDCLDGVIYFFAKFILRKRKAMSYRNILRRIRYLRKVARFMNKNTFDRVVFENSCSEYLCLKYRNNFAKYTGKVFYHAHNLPSAYKPFYKVIVKSTACFLCVSNYIALQYKTIFGGNCAAEFRVLRNAVDQSLFYPIEDKTSLNALRSSISLPPNKKIVLFSGRMTKDKGIFVLLDAFKKVNNDCHLLIVGDFFFGTNVKNKETKIISRMINELKERVSFTGFVPYPKMPDLYRSCDFCVVPSIWDDPAPLTIIEAISCGKPVITTKSGGICEYANDSCGFILDISDSLSDKIADAINTLSCNNELIARFEKGSILASKDLDLDRYYYDFVMFLDGD